MTVKEELEAREDRDLAPYAVRSFRSRGRDHPVEPDELRTEFQRDRDRIIHSKAFRRLEYKTQVFLPHEGDHFRTRLTHSLEVAQIATTIARALGLNSDLVEAIALGHDLGHTPFGHSGEDALDELCPDGFRHYEQSVRVVEDLEENYLYLGYRGLNLTWEVREGILKHAVWKRPLAPDRFPHLEPQRPPTLEGQVINIADPVAFISHDLDDGLRAGILHEEDLRKLAIRRKLAGKGGRPWTKSVIPFLVHDVIATTRRRLAELGIKTPEDARRLPELVVTFSPEVWKLFRELHEFLFQKLYYDFRVLRMRQRGIETVRLLWRAFTSDPRLLPPDTAKLIEERTSSLPAELSQEERVARSRRILWEVVRDYIAGMTDRYAFRTAAELSSPSFPPD